MKKILASLLVCSLLIPAALAADFEGTVSMKMSGQEAGGKNGGAVMNLSLKGGRTRAEMDSGGQNMSFIMDPAKQQMILLIAQQRMYMIQPIPSPAANPTAAATGEKPSDVTLEKTGVTEKILGYDCVKYVTKDKDKTTEIWLTDQLGPFMGLGNGGPMGRGRGQAPKGWEQLLQGKESFPMRVVSSQGGKEIGRLEVTAVEKKSLPDSLFGVPDGWQDMSGMMRGMGMPPGMRPPGGG